ncbi:type 1 fimbrial protein [Cronobacter malonaticus]|nr:type 1 fimbrial protein [Cronobacter malonaticus]ELY6202207.1 type 1 fimbrial protein [Cronobacter malonaticus]ELY6256871.1 type 1 fimbrial protein [Cronobacter malonaticus]
MPFELSVINCPATITAVEAAFSGVRDPHENNAYLNNGTGRGLALQIIESNSGMYMLPDGEPATAPVAPTTHSATWDFSARYIRTNDAFAPGSFDTAVQVTFTYR